MTVAFGNRRLVLYVSLFLLSAAVLGISAHFASVFLPGLHKDFTIFSLIVPSWTIFVIAIALQWSQARLEVILYFHLIILWITMGAWSTDIIGNVQCDALGGQRTPTKSGDMSAQSYCYEMKVVQAFSWTIFVFLTLAFIILLMLVDQAKRFGRPDIWYEPIREVGWFGEYPGYYNQGPMPPMTHMPSSGYQGSGYQGAYPNQHMMPQYYQQQPGQAIVVHPGVNGAAPTITTQPI